MKTPPGVSLSLAMTGKEYMLLDKHLAESVFVFCTAILDHLYTCLYFNEHRSMRRKNNQETNAVAQVGNAEAPRRDTMVGMRKAIHGMIW